MKNFINKILQRTDRHFHIEIDQIPDGKIEKLPTTLFPFIWFFMRQVKKSVIAIAVSEGLFAVLVSVMFWYVGELVKLEEYGAAMIMAGFALLAGRFVTGTLAEVFYHLVYTPYVGNLIRRQLYWYTARQSLSFFQNDFAGRIANKLLNSAPSLRDAIKSTIGSIWFAATFTISNLYFLFSADFYMGLPLLAWLVCYVAALAYFLPRIQKQSTKHSEDMSTLTGQVVDSLTNFLPTKYFARTDYEDKRVLGLLRQHSKSFRATTAEIWKLIITVDIFNILLLIATAWVGFHLVETQGQLGLAAIAMALPMALQATFQSGWIMFEVTGIFENLGTVQEGIEALSKTHEIKDRKNAKEAKIPKEQAKIEFCNVEFHYGQEDRSVMANFNLVIPAGQKVGLVGHSGAGKSTVTSLLVRAYDIEGGEILIGDENIAEITQESLRRHITVVTQDSYLFHRSVLENIRYGNPEASMEQVISASKQANAHAFIETLEDSKGRRGYDAHVGERGVKLSGGQRQRIGIARAVLKEAPILILDEATSALDSESEHAIQNALEGIMEGKTVIAIAHRLSTLRQMDRILVMEQGAIIEDGTHDELIQQSNGTYARLWKMQSGGFLSD